MIIHIYVKVSNYYLYFAREEPIAKPTAWPSIFNNMLFSSFLHCGIVVRKIVVYFCMGCFLRVGRMGARVFFNDKGVSEEEVLGKGS